VDALQHRRDFRRRRFDPRLQLVDPAGVVFVEAGVAERVEGDAALRDFELNCGGFGPSISTFCGLVMSTVVAPLQLASRNVSPIPGAARWG
jgi:hypothetical protein